MKLSYECEMRWGDLEGEGSLKRHCTQCGHDVFNLSAMTRAQTADFLAGYDQKSPCVRFKKSNGRIVHARNPQEQLDAQRRGARRLAAVALLAQAAFVGLADDPVASFFDPFNHAARILDDEPAAPASDSEFGESVEMVGLVF